MSILRSWTRRLNIVHEINVTGVTDVVLVLLIIFMIVAKRRAASRMRATSSVRQSSDVGVAFAECGPARHSQVSRNPFHAGRVFGASWDPTHSNKLGVRFEGGFHIC
jgi:hypothetical protein